MYPENIEEIRKKIDHEIHAFSSRFYNKHHSIGPIKEYLHEALQYILSGNGKRVRGILCVLVTKALGGSEKNALPAALALELVHAYSLVHDDLPMIDNDDYRRGMLTVHKKFDEPTALLVGDSLLTDAFFVLADQKHLFESSLSDSIIVRSIRELSFAAGGHGMVLGQHKDLIFTGNGTMTPEVIKDIHAHKTGKLMGASAALGAIIAQADQQKESAMRTFGELMGLTFQIVDDLLDLKSGTGKTPGKDLSAGKSTFVSAASEREILTTIDTLTAQALQCLHACGGYSADLELLFKLLTKRKK